MKEIEKRYGPVAVILIRRFMEDQFTGDTGGCRKKFPKFSWSSPECWDSCYEIPE